jgi:hypothetical protein
MRRRRHSLQVSTFPFLAVLLCAMGSLILVLLVMDRQARRAAQARAEKAALVQRQQRQQLQEAKRAEELKRREKERVAFFQAFRARRDALQQTLLKEKGRLRSRLQEHHDQLQEQAERVRQEHEREKQARQQAAEVAQDSARLQARLLAEQARRQAAAEQADSIREKVKQTTAVVERLDDKAEKLRKAVEKGQHTYSVIPYLGKRGANRRPVYLECTEEGVIFHPDHLLVSLPGNAGAIEQALKQRTSADAGAPPYALLLVRPAGIGNYYQVQALLHELDVPFGYEFVDADWVLEFPTEGKASQSSQLASNTGKNTPSSAGEKNPDRTGRGSGTGQGGVGPHRQGLPGGGSSGSQQAGPPRRSGSPGKGVQGGEKGPVPGQGGTHKVQGMGRSQRPPSRGAVEVGPPVVRKTAQAPQPQGQPRGRTRTQPVATAKARGRSEDGRKPVRRPNPSLFASDRHKPAEEDGRGRNRDRFPDLPGGPRARRRPAVLHGEQEWTIFLECRADGVILYPYRQRFSLAQLRAAAVAEGRANPLLSAVLQLIHRRQGGSRTHGPALRTQLRFLVRPDGLRSYHLAFPLLDLLGVPKKRVNLRAEDDVQALITQY